jgi:hypothetical protein
LGFDLRVWLRLLRSVWEGNLLGEGVWGRPDRGYVWLAAILDDVGEGVRLENGRSHSAVHLGDVGEGEPIEIGYVYAVAHPGEEDEGEWPTSGDIYIVHLDVVGEAGRWRSKNVLGGNLLGGGPWT